MTNYTNKISTSISKNDVKEILDAIDFINEKLSDLVTLSREELAALPKMGVNTIEFVTKNLETANRNPSLVPDNVDVEEIKKDVDLIKAIFKILEPLKKLEKKLEDSAMLAGSEAYLPSIAIYNAIKADDILKRHKHDEVNA